jgi:outer membrane protein OmpA-like peptidoglycan-associated protein
MSNDRVFPRFLANALTVLAILAALAALTANAASAAPSVRTASLSAGALRHELDSAEALLRTQFVGLPDGSNVVLMRAAQHLTVRIPERVLFDADSAQLKEAAALNLPWSAVIELLRKRHRLGAQIFVFTDSIGGSSINQSFSEERALALAATLHAASIHPDRVSAVGLGASAELASNDTPEGRERNRRVEIVIGPPPPRPARSR